jgi:polyisoprenyl-teichoic acid--peptidoglycan teichoic acid transferase
MAVRRPACRCAGAGGPLLDQIEEAGAQPTSARGRSPGAAAALSFLWPGLGQFYRGRRRLALVFALPPFVAVALLLFGLRRGAVVLAVQLFADRTAGLVAIAVVVAVGLWRLASVIHAYTGGAPGAFGARTRRLDRIVAAAVVAIIIASHLGVGMTLAYFSNTGAAVFTGNSDLVDLSTPVPAGSPSPEASVGASPTPTASPTAPPSLERRVTILFTGVDSSAGRSETLYDSIMVVSYDPRTNTVQMVSIPRDSAGFPLYFGGRVSIATRINSVPSSVKAGWIPSPDSPYMTLVREAGYLVGIPVDYYAVMDFVGFRRMIDMVGGIDIVNASVITDPTYNWLNGRTAGFYLATGPQHLDGDHALAYVRSRHGSSDWSRAGRQQQVIVALLRKMAQPDQILNMPNLISTLASSIATNFPPDQVADFVAIGQAVPPENIRQVVLGPPYSITGVNYLTSASTTCLLMPLVAGLSVQLFGPESLWYHKATPADTCGAPAAPSPTSGATPTPEVTTEPSLLPSATAAPAAATATPEPTAAP